LKSTQVLLKKIIKLVIETGTLTGTRLYPSYDITNEKPITLAAVVAIMILVLAVLPGHPTYFTTPAGILAKVYSNSMMVVLNNRMRIGTDAHPETNTIITHLRPDNGTDTYELGQGVLVTREEMVFSCDPDKVDGTGSQRNKSSYVV
jgi:hypothetical protein